MPTFPSIEPSYGFTKTQTPNVETIQLGDGYQQRFTKGLNQNPMMLSLAFNNLTEADADTIEAFFVARRGVENFDFTAPGESSAKKYICKSHRKQIRVPNRATITCEFEEVFEP